jgi:hypothetical protein
MRNRCEFFAQGEAVVMAVLVAALGVLAGCDDETGPLLRPQSLGGVVWETDASPVADVAISLTYQVATAADDPVTATRPPVAGQAARPARDDGLPAAATLRLYQNYPNPFSQQTTFRFALNQPDTVTLELLDIEGRHVRTLLHDAPRSAGEHAVEIPNNGADDTPILPNGYYLARLTATGKGQMRTDTVHGVLCNHTEVLVQAANAVTGTTGEFEIPYRELAVGSRIPTTSSDGPEILSWQRVPTVLLITARAGSRTVQKMIDLGDMEAWYYVELTLPPAPAQATALGSISSETRSRR